MCPTRLHSIAAFVIAGAIVSHTFSDAARHADYHAVMLAHVNYVRALHHLPPLCRNKKLQAAAKRHSNDMAKHDFMDHNGTDGSSVSRRITEAGYKWEAVAENVAAGQEDVESVMQAWMKSEGHRKNILDPSYTMFGTACTYNKRATKEYYWTQDFGSGTTEACGKDRVRHSKSPTRKQKKRKHSNVTARKQKKLKDHLKTLVPDTFSGAVAPVAHVNATLHSDDEAARLKAAKHRASGAIAAVEIGDEKSSEDDDEQDSKAQTFSRLLGVL
uniref:SCP domain-containing protein n=1 Tax=Peronospora matthiolae TaxID=2874970 RepID=A0AAV1TNZ3_9STRA